MLIYITTPRDAHYLEPGVCTADADCGAGNQCGPTTDNKGDMLCTCIQPGRGCRCRMNDRGWAGDAQLYSDCPTGSAYTSGCSVDWSAA